jgi:hypothetical protein
VAASVTRISPEPYSPVTTSTPRTEVVQPGVLCAADTVLDSGVRSVSSVELGEFPTRVSVANAV